MTEVLAMPIPALEERALDEAEVSGNLKTKITTGLAVGALSMAAWYAESRGYMSGLPPPAHSLRHPALGYYGAWAASKMAGRNKASAAVTGGIVGDFLGESGQDLVNRADHNPLNWLNLPEGAHNGGDLDNLVDFACCLGGTALFIAQNNQTFSWAKSKASRLRSRFSRPEVATAAMPAAD